MSISIINRGGVSGGLKPELTVTAPAGSTIDLLQNGIIVDTYTLGATETSHAFVVSVGTYTVKGTLGTQTKSVDVVIDAVAQYSAEIRYSLYLYNRGDECANVTGGFVAKAMNISSGGTGAQAPTVTRNSTNVVCTGVGQNGGALLTKNLIDLSQYSKLVFSGTVKNDTGTASWACVVGVRQSAKYYTDGPVTRAFNSGTYEQYEIDISNVNELCYVGLGVYKYHCSFTMTELYLD